MSRRPAAVWLMGAVLLGKRRGAATVAPSVDMCARGAIARGDAAKLGEDCICLPVVAIGGSRDGCVACRGLHHMACMRGRPFGPPLSPRILTRPIAAFKCGHTYLASTCYNVTRLVFPLTCVAQADAILRKDEVKTGELTFPKGKPDTVCGRLGPDWVKRFLATSIDTTRHAWRP